MPGPGRPYGLKNQKRVARSEKRVSVEGSRAIFVDAEAARRLAKSRTTRALRGGFVGTPDYAGGKALKEGLAKMAERVNAGDEVFGRFNQMDEQVLAEMYSANKLTFEVVFNYEGIRKNEQGEYVLTEDSRKQQDMDWMIQEYNRYAQATGRRAV